MRNVVRTAEGREANKKVLEEHVRTFLDINGLEGADFDDTPARVARLWDTFLNVEKPALHAFPTSNDELIVPKQYVLWGYCPHHLIPIRYTFKVGYIPRNKALGLSKFVRYSRYLLTTLPLQEDLPCLITDALEEVLEPMGVGCIVEGWHLCMVARGVEQQGSTVVTSSMKGLLLHSQTARDEFLRA